MHSVIRTRTIAVVCSLAVCVSCGIHSGGIKPARDKQTRKYGYYNTETKEWVIAPVYDDAGKFKNGFAEVEIQGRKGFIDPSGRLVVPAVYDGVGSFDKNGFCEVMSRRSGAKRYGVVDGTGRTVLPVEYVSVDVDGGGEIIYAKQDVSVPGFNSDQFWGIFNTAGVRLFDPQFEYKPSFRNGIGIAQSAVNGLYGIVSVRGEVLKPFGYLDIERSSGGYQALGTDMSHNYWDSSLNTVRVLPQVGGVIPYDPQGDPVRVAAWHKGPVGIRLRQNTVKKAELRTGYQGFLSKSNLSAVCVDLPVDWGYGRFVRLEPCKVPVSSKGAMSDRAGGAYTLKAFLYEQDGRLVRELSGSGWIEAVFADGAIYSAGGKESWLILADPNAIAVPAFTMDIFEYQAVSHADIFSGLSISPSELSSLQRLHNFRDACANVYEMENLGVCSYFPRVVDASHARAEHSANHAPVFRYRFRMGDVVNCKVGKDKGGEPELEFFDDLVCGFADKFSEPYYNSRLGDEIIYWGPHNARTVGLSLEAVSRNPSDGISDDLYGTGYAYRFVLSLYEEDGSWLRTLAEAPCADYVQGGVIVFEPLGIALRSPFAGRLQAPAQPSAQKPGTSTRQTQGSGTGQTAAIQRGTKTTAPRSGSRTVTEARGGGREGTEYKPESIEKGHKSFDIKDRKPYGPVMKLVQQLPVRTLSEFEKALGCR